MPRGAPSDVLSPWCVFSFAHFSSFQFVPNPSQAIAIPLNHTTTPCRYWGLRGFAVICMFAILLQAFVSPGLRMSPRAHFHLSTTHAHEHADGAAQRDTDRHADLEHHHPHRHSHQKPATHDHAVDSRDVVYVDAHEHESTSGKAPNRVVLDLDGLLFHRNPPSTDTSDRVVFAERASRFRTRTEPPLERPPRVVS